MTNENQGTNDLKFSPLEAAREHMATTDPKTNKQKHVPLGSIVQYVEEKPKAKPAKPSIVDQINMTSPLDVHRTAEELFHIYLPESLYLSHYELHELYPHISADEWRKFLRAHDRFIMKETALVTEASARSALKRLGSGQLKAGDATAIGQLLKQSEQINAQTKDRTAYVTMFLPDPNNRSIPETGNVSLYAKNRNNVAAFFDGEFLRQRQERGEVYLNADGTLHILDMNTYSAALDRAYLKLFNPENKKIIEQGEDKGRDWQ